MKKILWLLFLLTTIVKPQFNELHSRENIRKFADHLFCEKDYLRAVFEYEKLNSYKRDDTLEFKIALAYSKMGKYDIAGEKFYQIRTNSVFSNVPRQEYYKSLFQSGNYEYLQRNIRGEQSLEFQRLLYLSYLFSENYLPSEEEFASKFPLTEKKDILDFYNQKKEPAYKSSLFSGLMSAIIPGSGKIYTGNYGDGIMAFLATSVFAFLSYDNFSAKHNFRGWLFAGIGLFFYAGNIYGSIAAAQLHNVRVDYEYNYKLNEYLQNKNYFLPEYEFCN
jgi:TM2 domain-containing membrane protein YozV